MSAVQRIKAVHARNLAVQRSRLASMPEVGIFWLIDNKLVADSIPFPQADVYGGFYSGKNDHEAAVRINISSLSAKILSFMD
jgi:hypothetical protein